MTPTSSAPRTTALGGAILLAALLLLLAVPTPARAKSRELLLGIEPEHNLFTQMENYRKLAGYLSSKAGIPIRLTVMSRYGEVVQRFKTLHLDGALLNSYTATLAIDAMGMAPLVRPVNLADESLSRGVIFTRRDSGIRQVSEMRGRSFAFVDPATTEGYLFPLAHLRRNGITNPSRYLGRHFFTGSHASAISAVLDGRADLGAAKEAAYSREIAKDPAIARELMIIARSEPLPPATLFLREDLPPQIKQGLTDIFLQMGASAEGQEVLRAIGAQRFTPADPREYQIVRQLAAEAGPGPGGR